MVFFKKTLTHTTQIHPEKLGPNLKAEIKKKCIEEVQGIRYGDIGLIVVVLAIEDSQISRGVIDHLTGTVSYEVIFDAIVFCPFRNQVMDTVVSDCNINGFFAMAGPFTLYVSSLQIPEDYTYVSEKEAWVSSETTIEIKKGSSVRLKIMGTNAVHRTISGIGTINQPFLGVIA